MRWLNEYFTYIITTGRITLGRKIEEPNALVIFARLIPRLLAAPVTLHHPFDSAAISLPGLDERAK